MKVLPPTLRDPKRYLALELICEVRVSRDDFLNEVFSNSAALIGDFGSSQVGIRLLDFNDNMGILRCKRGSEDLTRAILATITRVGGYPIIVNVLGIAGTVRSATEKYIEKRDSYSVPNNKHI
ncbi:Rpp14/Pop5 family protein [Methanohalophilus mahii]|uniref:Ribonuclease P protein component 2 n=1 Tax=Methanohalophilus mahii (strain ATCC 35705 / DSM 5219 / SLP) TaxID=547558 RepID=D5EAW4_METMS|nr:Rpp14/Pop5 family protein [Methanohalophilus mahii]ADE36315.1 Ribonuclease P-related protein [Methanohalophilus mahii DSM 5219]